MTDVTSRGLLVGRRHGHDPGIPVVTQDDDYVHAPGQEVIHI